MSPYNHHAPPSEPFHRASSSSSPSSDHSSSSATLYEDSSSTWSLSSIKVARSRAYHSRRQILVILIFAVCIVVWFAPPPSTWGQTPFISNIASPLAPYVPLHTANEPDPIQWLRDNSDDRHSVANAGLTSLSMSSKPKAALISLVRSEEVEGMVQSMRQLEFRWNRKYQYPWIFFNDKPFTEEFKRATRNMTSAKCYYEVVPIDHWSLPEWVDEGRFMNSLEYLGAIGVGKGWMISYRHMCRWNSGFFYRHPRLLEYDFYWRVEPDVHFFCDINYDVFRFVRDNKIKYGFTMNILDDARSFPSLWSRTMSFINAHPELIHPEADLDWLLDPFNGGDYNNCQFFSNFEVGDLRFFRGEANEKYFKWLDRGGGFYYERFGDAPIHTLSVAMFVPKREIWYFRDIGYQHDINRHCPPHSSSRCDCEPTPLDENFYKLVPLESPQKKPADTCIRQFLGGDWIKKKEGWSQDGERAFGGDGYHGYVKDGFEVSAAGWGGGDEEAVVVGMAGGQNVAANG